jgi:hypothetical protein
VNAIESDDGFEFNDDQPSDDEVYALSGYFDPAICHADGPFDLERNAARFQFDAHRFSINRFEKSRPERAMNRDSGANRMSHHPICLRAERRIASHAETRSRCFFVCFVFATAFVVHVFLP